MVVAVRAPVPHSGSEHASCLNFLWEWQWEYSECCLWITCRTHRKHIKLGRREVWITWRSRANHVSHVGIRWQSRGNHMAVTFLSHGRWESRGGHMTFAWGSRCSRAWVTWQSRSGHVRFTCQYSVLILLPDSREQGGDLSWWGSQVREGPLLVWGTLLDVTATLLLLPRLGPRMFWRSLFKAGVPPATTWSQGL